LEMNRSDWEFMGRIAAACQALPVAPLVQPVVEGPLPADAVRIQTVAVAKKAPVAKKPTAKKAKPKQPTAASGKIRACKVCGKEFTPKTSAKTCGPECAKENARRAKNKNRTHGGKLGFRKCVTCGDEFKVKHADQKVCSEDCRPKVVDKAARLAALKDAARRVGITERDPLAEVDRVARNIEREERGA
jgi:predicted nucleic acid-binding Zn ribbon protein